MSDQVVLLDEAGTAIGVADKSTVHTADTPLHFAFSCYVFSPEGQLLVTRRALGKRTWPGVWSNSFCGHPRPGEAIETAVARHAAFELGLELHTVRLVLPDFRYRAVDASGIVENELCPVFVATAANAPQANLDEVAEISWINPNELRQAAELTPWAFSPWMCWQLPLLYDAGAFA